MLASFLQEDIGTGDITSNSVVDDIDAKAEIICKTASATVCGLEEVASIFDICGCSCKILAKDGSHAKKGMRVMTISGKARSILKAERTALNLLMRMSGIATETKALAEMEVRSK
jgi:nicotinate-nucleotide pyrophosphorylase (carboxylating)